MREMLLLGMPSGWEWLIILLVIVLLFGGSRLPQLARALGQSKRAFKEGLDDAEEEAKLDAAKRRERLGTAEEEKVAANKR